MDLQILADQVRRRRMEAAVDLDVPVRMHRARAPVLRERRPHRMDVRVVSASSGHLCSRFGSRPESGSPLLRYDARADMGESESPRELRPRANFRAVVGAIVPRASELDGAGWLELEAIVERAVSERPAALRRQLRLLLGALDLLALASSLRPFAALDVRGRERVLGWLEDNPLLLLRRGFWGLKTLALMGFYCRRSAVAQIGYRAAPGGWGARG
jgi:hypothetical protein